METNATSGKPVKPQERQARTAHPDEWNQFLSPEARRRYAEGIESLRRSWREQHDISIKHAISIKYGSQRRDERVTPINGKSLKSLTARERKLLGLPANK